MISSTNLVQVNKKIPPVRSFGNSALEIPGRSPVPSRRSLGHAVKPPEINPPVGLFFGIILRDFA
jgi:hypothetical protein